MAPIDQFLIRYEGRSIGPWRYSRGQSLGTQSESMHSCSPGSRLAHYRVGSSLGVGLSGEVFEDGTLRSTHWPGQPVMFALCRDTGNISMCVRVSG